MKTKQLILSGAVLMMSVALSLTSCRKDNSKDADKDTSGAEDNSLADKSFDDMGQISNEAANGNVGSFKMGGDQFGLLSACATVTHDTALKTITVDFGSTNCACQDGHNRRGKIFITYTKGFHNLGYWDSLASHTITTAPDYSYFVDDNQVKGSRTVTNNGHNSAGHMNWSVSVNGEIVKANSQGTVIWTSTRNREWLAGEATPFIWSDDEYGITGSASGTSAKGVNFDVTITSQLIRKLSCFKHFVSGTLDFTPGTKPVRHVDFSYSQSPDPAGSCDDLASVTINSNTYIVHMK